MNKIEVFFSPTNKLDVLEDSLYAAGIASLSLIEMKVFNKDGSKTEKYRGVERVVHHVNKIKAEIVVSPENAHAVLNIIKTFLEINNDDKHAAFVMDLTNSTHQADKNALVQ